MVKTVRKSSRVKRSRKHNRRHTRRNRGGAINPRQSALKFKTKSDYEDVRDAQKENDYKTLFIMLYGLPEEELAKIRTSADVKHKFEEIRRKMIAEPDFAYKVYSWAYLLMKDRPYDATEIFDVHGRRPSHVAFDILPGPLSEQQIAGLPLDPQFEKARHRYLTVMADLQ